MTNLAIDIETYSTFDLPNCGVYKYVESPDFTVPLFAYAVDFGAVKLIDLAMGETLPAEILDALTDPDITKTAYNATFERICLSKYLGVKLSIDQWQCTMVTAARVGFPMGLADCAKAMGVVEKMSEGASLIRYFSKPTVKGVRRMPLDAPERWATFKEYCRRDVEVEQAILKKVKGFPFPAFDKQLYNIDQTINDRGVKLDVKLIENAIRLNEEYVSQLMDEARKITGLENPNSVTQLKEWIAKTTGMSIQSLAKGELTDLHKKFQYYPKVQRLLDLRKEIAKTSNAKYSAMMECICKDGRVHGLMQFYGSHTGRWAGRLVQVQNLPQNHLPDLDNARQLVLRGDLDDLELEYSSVNQVLSELIRTAFISDTVFHVCDFSAIEARVIAWLAGETWAVEAFRNGKDIYCETASQMFKVPVEKHGANAHLRAKGKIAVLALGYGGGIKALEAMGGKKMGMDEEELSDTVTLWRNSNKHIVKLWWNCERAAVKAIEDGRAVSVGKLVFDTWRGCLTITLPSGRKIAYPRAQIAEKGISYEGMTQTSRKWEEKRTYGGRLVENIIQAIARDILGEVIIRAYNRGYKVVFHVHDEIIVESQGEILSDIVALFDEEVSWAKGLPLKGAGYSTPYYIKD